MPEPALFEGHGGAPPLDADDDEDDDPVVATYSVFIKPPLPENRQLIILQYVNKTSQDPSQIPPPRVTELRVKPTTGMFEVDVPIDTSQAYDQGKGIRWGTVLQKSMETKKGGSLGLAGGFGIGAAASRANAGGRRGGAGGGGLDDGGNNLSWGEATRQDKVLRTQTMGGGRSAEEESARYMVGVFQGKNIHLTPVSSLVHLRPIPHHLDAATEQERLARPAPGGAAAAAAAEKAAGRAIHMTLKAAMDDDGVATETMADRLRAVQSENWRRMEWVHDEAEAAWEAYNESLLLRTGDSSSATDDVGASGKGKELDDSGAPDLVEKVPRLQTDWGEEELLRAVSGIKRHDKKPGEEAVTQSSSVKAVPKGKGKAKALAPAIKPEEQGEEPRKRPGRPPKSAGTAAPAAPRRGGRAKAAGRVGAGPSDAMQVD